MWTLFSFIVLAVAFIGGLNTVLEFCERVYGYKKALNSQQKDETKQVKSLPSTSRNLNRHSVFGFAPTIDILSKTHRDIDHFLPACYLKKI